MSCNCISFMKEIGRWNLLHLMSLISDVLLVVLSASRDCV